MPPKNPKAKDLNEVINEAISDDAPQLKGGDEFALPLKRAQDDAAQDDAAPEDPIREMAVETVKLGGAPALAGFLRDQALQDEVDNVSPLLQVHDELVFSVPTEGEGNDFGHALVEELSVDVLNEMVKEIVRGTDALDNGDFVDLDELQEEIVLGRDWRAGVQTHPEMVQPSSHNKELIDDGDTILLGSEVDIPEMEFGVFEFRREGLNVTVRRGDRWDGLHGYVLGVPAGGNPENQVVELYVLETMLVYFCDLDEGGELHALLQFEHDPACRDYYSLVKAMRVAYPTATPTTAGRFEVDELVTVVLFTVY